MHITPKIINHEQVIIFIMKDLKVSIEKLHSSGGSK